MFREKQRYGQEPDLVVRSAERTFNAPLRWNKQVQGNYPCGKPLVFVCSWSDFWIEEADAWRDEAMEIMANCSSLIFLILTKRPERILPWLDDACYPSSGCPIEGFPNNVWLGVSVENGQFIQRIDHISQIDAGLRFISYEPALGPLGRVSDNNYLRKINWVISGGESCSDRRADMDWFRHIREICECFDIPYFHKQNGGRKKIDGVYGGDKLDGVVYHQYPKVGI